jgi:hypothetical protein
MPWHPEAGKLDLIVKNKTVIDTMNMDEEVNRANIIASVPTIVDNAIEIQVEIENLPDDPDLMLLIEYKDDKGIYYPIEILSRDEFNASMTFQYDINDFPESNQSSIRISLPQVRIFRIYFLYHLKHNFYYL